MTKIEININEDCKLCKEGLKYFKSLLKRHKNIYANMNMKNYTFIDGIILSPDYNASGYLTHFHISRASKKTLQLIIKQFENQNKESKIIIKAKKENKNK